MTDRQCNLWTLVSLILVLLVGAFMRYDAYRTEGNTLQANYNYAREGAAIALAKGYGFRIYPVPNYRGKRGRMIDPKEYMTWSKTEPDPAKMQYLAFNPGPPVIMAATYRLFDFKHGYYQIFQLIVSLAMAPMLFYVGWAFFGSRLVGVLAAALQATTFFEIKYSLYIAREIYPSLGVILVLMGIGCVLRNRDGESQRRLLIAAALTGAGLGITLQFREVVAPMLVVFVFAMAVFLPWRRAIGTVSVFVVAMSLVLAPWVLRNKNVFGEFFIGKESKAFAAWVGIGTNPNPLGLLTTDSIAFSSLLHVYGVLEKVKLDGTYYGSGAVQVEAVATNVFQKYVRTHPNTYLKSVVNNFRENLTNFTEWQYYPFRAIAVPNMNRTRALIGPANLNQLIKGWERWLTILPYLALAGAFFGWLKTSRTLVLVLGVLGCLLSISLVTSHNVKYTYHVLPIYYVLAAYLVAAAARLIWQPGRIMGIITRGR